MYISKEVKTSNKRVCSSVRTLTLFERLLLKYPSILSMLIFQRNFLDYKNISSIQWYIATP